MQVCPSSSAVFAVLTDGNLFHAAHTPVCRETLRQARADLAALKRREGDARKTLEAKEKRLGDLQVCTAHLWLLHC